MIAHLAVSTSPDTQVRDAGAALVAASPRRSPGIRADNLFFSGMAGIALLAVYAGFATITWDRWSSGRVQRVTALASVFLLTVQEARHFVGYTTGWQHFAAWVERHMTAFH